MTTVANMSEDEKQRRLIARKKYEKNTKCRPRSMMLDNADYEWFDATCKANSVTKAQMFNELIEVYKDYTSQIEQIPIAEDLIADLQE